MPDARTLELVRSTLPAIRDAGPAVTEYFYQRMFRHHPELKNVFNMTHQQNGQQPAALFGALCAYGAHLDTPQALQDAVERIAQKHTSLNIRPEQYAIVGEHLLGTLRELLDPGEEVLAAWAEVYGVLAEIFIHREAAIYQQGAQQLGGWQGDRPFVISQIVEESNGIRSFVLTPQDGLPVPDFIAGQYVTVSLQPAEWEYRQLRQYSLTRPSVGKDYRIAVRHQPQGKVSGWFHQQARCGDRVLLSVPSGDFRLQGTQTPQPVTLISAGSGLTPMLAMLHQLAESRYPARVNWWHGTTDPGNHAFAEEVSSLGTQLEHFSQQIWYSQIATHSEAYCSGRMDIAQLTADAITAEGDYYLCGPADFMQSMLTQLTARGISRDRIHYEMFGPHQTL